KDNSNTKTKIMENNNQVLRHEGFDISRPKEAIEVANILQVFVKKNELTQDIQGKAYPLVEAWQFCGSQFGLYPIMVECKNESDYEDRHYQWKDKRNNPREKKTKH